MTQLIGAICEEREKVVLLSDRQVERAGLTFEREPKGTIIATNAVALTAGTAHEPEIVEGARNKFLKQTPPPPISDLTRFLIDNYQETRLTRITDEILRPRGFKSIEDFYSKQRVIHESVTFELNSAIEGYDLDLFILLGSVDEEAHLVHVVNPGTVTDYTSIAFSCPGMGREQAESTFVFYNFSPCFSLERALHIAYLAKERARMAGSVGPMTDGWIIDKKGVNAVDDETFRGIRRYWRRRKAVF